jgi:uncharacterized protein
MILGKICGKVTTKLFRFIVEGNPQKFEYIQVFHKDYEFVLCQIVEIERNNDETIAICTIIGYKDSRGRVKPLRTPFDPGTEVLRAEDSFIKDIIKLDDKERSAYIGFLEGKKIPVYLNLNKLLTKHIAILAKSGAGKSYSVGVLLEEIMEKKVPLLIIDPHGEYTELKYPNDKDQDQMEKYSIRPKGYAKNLQEYGDQKINPHLKPLRLADKVTATDLLHMLPTKLSGTQQNVLYSAFKNADRPTFSSLIEALELEESNAKFSVINTVDTLSKSGIFSSNPTPYLELVQPGKCTIINLKGIEPSLQEIIAYKLLYDLFELRKQEKIPPFFTVIEEAHIFCPERSFGETKASQILRTIAAEGRKFGQGLAIISQRPARVDKSVLSQCSTQMILKVTNPNDLKAISNSVEGITTESEKEISNLSIGTALVTGIVDVPLFVNIRTRRSKHGGESIDMLSTSEEYKFMDQVEEYEQKEILPLIMPKITLKDIQLMDDRKIKNARTILVPGALFVCEKETEFKVLADLYHGGIVAEDKLMFIPDLSDLSKNELLALKTIFRLKKATIEELSLEKLKYIESSIERLLAKQFIAMHENKYEINEQFVFASLKTKQSHQKISFNQIEYHEKAKTRFSIDDMKKQLTNYVTVKDIQECFLVRYEIEYEK